MRNDPKLIGYWFTDCPTWVHHDERTAWKAPLFDPAGLKTEAGRRELTDLATTYYRVTTESIRRYDPITSSSVIATRPTARCPTRSCARRCRSSTCWRFNVSARRRS